MTSIFISLARHVSIGRVKTVDGNKGNFSRSMSHREKTPFNATSKQGEQLKNLIAVNVNIIASLAVNQLRRPPFHMTNITWVVSSAFTGKIA